jgi:hypothetical protein
LCCYSILDIFDRQGSLDIFSGAPPQPYPTLIELRDMVLRPRVPQERYTNDVAFSIATAPLGASSEDDAKYLARGHLLSIHALSAVKILAEGLSGPAITEPLGDVHGRRDFAFAMKAFSGASHAHVKVLDGAGEVLAEQDVQLLPGPTYLREATDVPSVAMQMPQILAKSGVKYLMLGCFQPGLYDWYSPDGSKIVVGSLGIYGRLSAYLTPYNPVDVAVQIPSLLRNWDSYYAEHKIPPQFPITDMTDYLPPNQELITLADQWKSDARGKYGDPVKLKFATGEEFMQSVTHDPNTRFPQVHGEWPNVWAYIHGPTHLETISAGREASWDLVAAEKFWTLRTLTSGGSERYPTETFD